LANFQYHNGLKVYLVVIKFGIMIEAIQIPIQEYQAMKEEISLLKDNVLLEKMNRLVELLYEDKYGLYLGNQTNDLTEKAINNNWLNEKSVWDNV
jgi:hypothetical protein